MSKEQLKAFLEKVKGDTSLQEKLKAATDAELAIAKEACYMNSTDAPQKALMKEVSEETLEVVNGGGGDFEGKTRKGDPVTTKGTSRSMFPI